MNLVALKTDNWTKVILTTLVIYLVSIIYSKFLLSLSLIALTLFAIYHSYLNKDDKFSLRTFVQSKSFLSFWIVFLLFLLSGINSENTAEWMHQVKLKLPFLLFPFCFFVFRDIVIKNYYLLLLTFVGLCFISTFPVLINVLSDHDKTVDIISKGQSIETPVDHIKYSLFLAFSALSCLVLLVEKPKPTDHKLLQILLLVCLSFLVFFLHFLAVRSGLAVFYVCAFFLAFKYFYLNKINRVFIIGIGIAAILLGFVAVQKIPTLQSKWGYMKYDFEMFVKGEGKNYSDSDRIYSYQLGWKLFKQNPFFGTGIGDLLDDCNKLSQELNQRPTEKYPHNMYLFILTGLGGIGLIFFLAAFLWPILQRNTTNHTITQMFYLLILVSFLVENTIQRSYGTAFFLFFALAGLCMLHKKSPEKSRL